MRCDKAWLCRQIEQAINKDVLLYEDGIRAEFFESHSVILLTHVETNRPFAKVHFEWR